MSTNRSLSTQGTYHEAAVHNAPVPFSFTFNFSPVHSQPQPADCDNQAFRQHFASTENP